MSAVSWFRLPRGRVWHVALGARALCGAMLPGMGGEWQRNLPPMRARVCSECVDADLRLRDNITQALDRGDLPLPLGDDHVVDAEIVEDDADEFVDKFRRDRLAEFETNDVAVIREERLLMPQYAGFEFGSVFAPAPGELDAPFPFAGVSIVNGTVTGSIEVEDVDGKLAAQIAEIDQGGALEAGFDPDGDEIVVDPDRILCTCGHSADDHRLKLRDYSTACEFADCDCVMFDEGDRGQP